MEKEYTLILEDSEIKGIGLYLAQSKPSTPKDFFVKQFCLEAWKKVIKQYKAQGGK